MSAPALASTVPTTRLRRRISPFQRPALLLGCAAPSPSREHEVSHDLPDGASRRPLRDGRIRRVPAGGERGQLRRPRQPRDGDRNDGERQIADRAELEQIPGRVPAEVVTGGEGGHEDGRPEETDREYRAARP